jgi:RNA polymerase sigma factor (sigma-70 family)
VTASPRKAQATSLPPFARVVELYGPALLRFCASEVGSERAEDCFQETMLAALRNYNSVRDPQAVRSWLFAIAANKAVDAHRPRAHAPTPVADITFLADSKQAEIVIIHDQDLWARVRALPRKQQQAVTLRFLADFSYREIAEVMQVSVDAARRSVFEGLKKLREIDLTF